MSLFSRLPVSKLLLHRGERGVCGVSMGRAENTARHVVYRRLGLTAFLRAQLQMDSAINCQDYCLHKQTKAATPEQLSAVQSPSPVTSSPFFRFLSLPENPHISDCALCSLHQRLNVVWESRRREQLGHFLLAEISSPLLLCCVKWSFPPSACLQNVRTNCWVTDEGEGNLFFC